MRSAGDVRLELYSWGRELTVRTFELGKCWGSEMLKRNLLTMAGKNGNGADGGDGGDGEGKTGLVTKTRPKTKRPSLYKVLLLNDDYTPMEFVVHVLERFFNKGREDATRIMLHVHQKGVGICGVYTYEIAETKVAQVMDFARQNQHPLQCTMEKE
jgi:ATP-dependent Clp protease adaptor protein ClpS